MEALEAVEDGPGADDVAGAASAALVRSTTPRPIQALAATTLFDELTKGVLSLSSHVLAARKMLARSVKPSTPSAGLGRVNPRKIQTAMIE